jgi:hypothetical protein
LCTTRPKLAVNAFNNSVPLIQADNVNAVVIAFTFFCPLTLKMCLRLGLSAPRAVLVG